MSGTESIKLPLSGYQGAPLASLTTNPSSVHANFIVNRKNATQRDILRLMETVRQKVRTRYGIDLVPEIIVP